MKGVELVGSSRPGARIVWAGERIADLAEGKFTSEQAWYVWNVIVGWLDVDDGHANEYRTLARMVQGLAREIPTPQKASTRPSKPGRKEKRIAQKVKHASRLTSRIGKARG